MKLLTMKRLAVGAALALALAVDLDPSHALAQGAPCGGATVFAGAGQGCVQANTEGTKASYRASFVALVPPAASTDFACIAGSATKTIRVTRLQVQGTAGTLVTTPIYIAKRVLADTAGTPATALALPVAGKLDTADAAASATLVAYTANPTINDASPFIMGALNVTLPTAAAGTVVVPAVWDFTTRNARGLVLRGAAQQACLNLNGATVTTPSLAGELEWTEE